ncbi:MAG TPA: serine/threonine-protein kinase [Actinomycetota bacterium]|nr:serine/threonine-protein kinase [Actinomycetota bacterium]
MSTPEGGEVVADRYRLASLIGRGGNGAVWRAQDTLLGRAVAVKRIEIPPQLNEAEGARVRRKVLHEARACARLTHPGAVTVFDVVEDDGRPCIVMELVDAPSLAERVQDEGPLSPSEAADLGLQLLDTLQAAHRQGIVHRDIKPGNILVPPGGHPKLADFGIASIVGEPGMTTTGLIPGSPAYMSPEQAAGGAVGAPSDLWSLGAALYFAVEGVPPFIKLGPLPTMVAIVNDEPRGPVQAGPLAPALMALLTKDPQTRPDAARAGELLREALTPSGPEADGRDAVAPTAPLPPAPTPVRSQPPEPLSPRTPPPETPSPRPKVSATPPFRLRPIPERVVEPVPGPVPAPVRSTAPSPGPRPSPAPISAPSPPAGLPPGSAPPTFKWGGGPGRYRPSGPVLAGLLCLVAVAAVAAAVWGYRTGGTPSGQAPPASSPAASPAAGAAVPSTWVRYTDPATGFVIAHPPTWTVVAQGTRTDVRDPASGSYLRVDHREPPGPSAIGAWQDQEKSFKAQYAGYRRVQLAPTTFDGFPGAVWEFTYPAGSLLHAADLGFITGRYGFALYFQTTDSNWQRLQPLFDGFKQSFQAPKG